MAISVSVNLCFPPVDSFVTPIFRQLSIGLLFKIPHHKKLSSIQTSDNSYEISSVIKILLRTIVNQTVESTSASSRSFSAKKFCFKRCEVTADVKNKGATELKSLFGFPPLRLKRGKQLHQNLSLLSRAATPRSDQLL